MVIFDDVSIEWAPWNNVDAVGASDITIQYSITADPIHQQFAAHTETGPYTWYGQPLRQRPQPVPPGQRQHACSLTTSFTTSRRDILRRTRPAGSPTTSSTTTSSPDRARRRRSNAFFQVNDQEMYRSGNHLDSNDDGTLNGSPQELRAERRSSPRPGPPVTAAMPTVSAARGLRERRRRARVRRSTETRLTRWSSQT